jgi:hypothetical protein
VLIAMTMDDSEVEDLEEEIKAEKKVNIRRSL